MSVRVFAPAKINLTLQVGRPRADGMHPLQSAVMFADVGDWIEAEVHPDSPFHIRGPFSRGLRQTNGNLVLEAFAAIRRASGIDLSATVTLEKNLPVASGIGGGSSDAAATLKALNALWELELSEAELMCIAAEIGADVPVCVPARTAWMTGVGDVIAPLQAPALHAVLVNPLKPLPTAAVFGKFDEMGLGRRLDETQPPVWRTPAEAAAGAAALGNDLAAPACALAPEIAVILEALRQDARVAHAGLSGSGATCFALLENAAAASALAGELAARRRDWWVRAARLGAA
jgi:4-diphosphocytidyl-2-C-methyl-D-erythritol kinase